MISDFSTLYIVGKMPGNGKLSIFEAEVTELADHWVKFKPKPGSEGAFSYQTMMGRNGLDTHFSKADAVKGFAYDAVILSARAKEMEQALPSLEALC